MTLLGGTFYSMYSMSAQVSTTITIRQRADLRGISRSSTPSSLKYLLKDRLIMKNKSDHQMRTYLDMYTSALLNSSISYNTVTPLNLILCPDFYVQ